MQQTVNEAVECHRKLWHGIANEIRKHGFRCNGPGILKKKVLHELFPVLANGEIQSDCFLCQFTADRHKAEYGDKILDCNMCPFVEQRPTICLNGLHSKFTHAYLNKNREEAVWYAEQIADLLIVNPLYGKDDDHATDSK